MTTQKAAEAALEPCPFCGDEPYVIEDDSYNRCHVGCNCEAEPTIFRDKGFLSDCIAAWNRRSLPSGEVETAAKHLLASIEHELRCDTKLLVSTVGAAEAVRAALTSPEGRPQGGEVLDERMKEINRARGIIEGLKQWRENVLTCPLHIEPDARRRIRELCTPPRDDHDRAVIMVLDDIERLIRAIATTPPSPKEG